MKNFGFVFCWLLIAPAAFAAGLTLDGPKFSAPGINIVWNAETNKLPKEAWIYRIVDNQFSPSVFSNLLAIGSFTIKDRTKVDGDPPLKDKRFSFFAGKEKAIHHLGMFPATGWAYYRNARAEALGAARPQSVPSESEAVSLGLQWAKRFGIERSELATKGDSSELQTYRCQKTKEGFRKEPDESPPEVISRGIAFVRQLDGIPFTGHGEDGGLSIDFGDQGKIAQLQLVWRKLQRHKSCGIFSPSEIVDCVRQGKARISPFTMVNVNPAKRLIIKSVVCAYLGAGGDESQEFLYPFAALVCKLEAKSGDGVEIILNCPILPEE